MRKALSISLILVISFAVSGCVVSKKEYLLKEEELGKCSDRLKAALGENETLKKELGTTQTDLTACQKESASLDGQLKEMTTDRDDLDRKLATQEAVNDELKNQNDRLGDLLQKKETSAKDIIGDMQQTAERLRESNQGLRERIDAYESQLTAAQEVEKERDALLKETDSLNSQIEDLSRRKDEELNQLKSTYDELVSGLKSEIEAGEIQIRRMKDRLSVNMAEKILFDSGRANIKSKGLEVLKKVGDELAKIENKRIQIEGHTDDVPIGGKLKEVFPTNWELASSRAMAVVHFLQDDVGIDPARLSGAGYGEYQPAADNDTEEGRASNRRIEIVLLPLYERTSEAQEATDTE
jgi:chemotaxis protein MotB